MFSHFFLSKLRKNGIKDDKIFKKKIKWAVYQCLGVTPKRWISDKLWSTTGENITLKHLDGLRLYINFDISNMCSLEKVYSNLGVK